MTAVRDLPFAHRFTLHGGGPHLGHVDVEAVAPLTADGVSTFVRYRDAVATRYGYVVSRWAVDREGAVEAEVLLYAVDGDADGSPPRHHPSEDRRLRQIAELAAATDPAAALVPSAATSAAPSAEIWVRADGGGPVPAALEPSDRLDGVTRVRVLGVGVVPQDTVLLLARPGLAEEAADGPVDAEVHACTYRDEEKVAAKVRSGRGRPAARLTFGTLEQLTEGPAR
ncbi:hypothetical protein [Georgenia daeguensis]|uniref:Uncharacterized protein n=1 Tax=Georgenia daeguensis TaxID=908355 RepID=A0ABP8EVE7_9MICO